MNPFCIAERIFVLNAMLSIRKMIVINVSMTNRLIVSENFLII